MMLPTAKRSKYKAVKTVVDGHKFDSLAEAKHYQTLKLMQEAGLITGLVLQPTYILVPSVKFKGDARAKPAIRYRADFGFTDVKTGEQVTCDVKGMVTDVYRLKKHMMLALLGIEITEIKKK